MNEPRLYCSTSDTLAGEHRPPPPSGGGSGLATAAVDAAVARHVLPLMPALLEDEDPMPL